MNVVLLLGAMIVSQAQPADSWLDLSSTWRFKPDPEHAGLRDGWNTAACNDADWTVFDAGSRWEDHGFPDLDGYAWFRRSLSAPPGWQGKEVWLLLGGVNDACAIYCNGERVNSYGDDKDFSVASTPIIADLSPWLRPGEANLLAIECLDFGGSGGLWRLPCALTTDSARLPLASLVSCMTEYEAHRITVDVNLAAFGNDHPDGALKLALFKKGKDKPKEERVLPVSAAIRGVSTAFALDGPDESDVYRIQVAASDPSIAVLAGLTVAQDVPWPAAPRWGGDYADLKVRNNFVTELLTLRLEDVGADSYSILNPRDGWVFFTAATDGGEGPRIIVDGEPSPVPWRRNPATRAFEAMRRLAEGKHVLMVAPDAKGKMEVCTVPELTYCYYPTEPHIKPFGPYDWQFVSRYVLPHVNTIITSSAVPEDEFEKWWREGRAWVANASLPGLSDPQAPTADAVYAVWAAIPGATQPGFSGIIVDEFLYASADHYRAWTEAMGRLHDNPAFEGRTFYAWCGDLYQEDNSLDFRRRVAELDNRFAWEKYLPEAATEEEASRAIGRDLQQDMTNWQASMPDVAQRTVMTLGYLCAPPESLNLNPAVDYQVFMDMQFQRLATEPTFWGLYGVMEYSASYADEESLRWAHQLFRHYCIEGSRERLTHDPYLLPHVQNPDFIDGLNGWRVEAAEEGAIAPDTMEAFSWLEGRYPRTKTGDQFCRMTRSATRPNRIGQTVQALQPGRLYSVKLIAAAIDQMDRQQALALRIQVDGAEPMPDFGFSFAYPSNYAHTFGPYNREHPAWFTFQRYVFRATAETAELRIADWVTDDTPGGDAGQRIGFNFVEVQPFHAP